MPASVTTAGGPHSVSSLSKYPSRGSSTRSSSPSGPSSGVQSVRLSDTATLTNFSPQYIQ